ncbi:MAG: M13 family peptidase, partial [Gammaproteobacteria bacterium]|nr:M13 family peptidase [Gammaproteobacteria bacterium]
MQKRICPTATISLAPVVVLALLLPACSNRPEASVAGSPATSGFDPAELDSTVRPQDDLWNHANGKWLATTPIPGDQADYGSFRILIERTEEQLRALLESSASGTGARHADPDARRTGDLYASFMDEATLEQQGVTPLGPELAAIAALRTHRDVVAFMGSALAAGIQGPVQWYTDADADDPDRNLAYFWQDGLGLPDRDYYLDDRTELRAAREAYGTHIAELWTLAGWTGSAEARRVIPAIEERLATLHWSAVQNRDAARIYRNQRTPAAAAAETPGFDWPAFLTAAGLPDLPLFVVAQPDYFQGLGRLIGEIPVTEWQLYFRFKTLKRFAPFLNAAIVAEDFDFEGRVLNGQTMNRPRWRRGVRLVNSELGEALG